MRASIVLLGLTALVSAKDVTFSMSVAGNNTEFYDMPLNAVDGGFWINRHAKQYCPPNAHAICYNGTNTVVSGTTDKKGGPISLNSMVPGGQDIYITKDGALRFTKAHMNDVPSDAIRNPKDFTYQPPKGKYADVGRLNYGKDKFALCGPEDPIAPTYQLFVGSGKLEAGCVPVEIGARIFVGKSYVWQYD